MKKLFAVLVALVLVGLPSASALSLDFLSPSVDFEQCKNLSSMEKLSCVVGLQGSPNIMDIGNVLGMAFWLLSVDFKAFIAFVFIVLGVSLTFQNLISFWFPKMEIAKMILRVVGAGIGVFFVIPYILS